MQQVRGPFLFIFRAAAGALAFAAGSVALVPAAAAQTIYKWVDERGVVNYGNTDIPKTADVKVVDVAPPVAVPPPQLNAKPRDAAALRPARLSDADMLREELMRSREEIARLRQQTAAQSAAGNSGRGTDGYAAWREECERQHRIACDEAAYAAETQPGPVLIRQPVVFVPKAAPGRLGQERLQVAGSPKPAPKPSAAGRITAMQ